MYGGISQINVNEIIPNRFQPRKNFNQDDIKELAESIKQFGMFQPMLLRKLQDRYEIIAGERRFKAANMIGMQTVPAIVMELDDLTSAGMALAENLQRKDLSAIEKAKAYEQMLNLGQLTQEELAKRMGKSQSSISNTLRLLNLSEEVQKSLLDGKISERHARSLLPLKDDTEKQKRLLNTIIERRMTVRETDIEVQKVLNEKDESSIPEEIIDFETETNEVETIDADFIIEEIEEPTHLEEEQNKNEDENEILNIPTMEPEILEKNKTSFLFNNAVNLDDEEANMNFGNENKDNTFINQSDFSNMNQQSNEQNTYNQPNPPQQGGYNPYGQNYQQMPPQQGGYNPYGQNYQQTPPQQGGYNPYGQNYQQMPPQQGGYNPYGQNYQQTPPQQGGYNQYDQNYQQTPQQQGGYNPYDQNYQPPQSIQPATPNYDQTNIEPVPSSIYDPNIIGSTDLNIPQQGDYEIEETDSRPQAMIAQQDITGAVAVIRNTVMNLQNNGYLIDIDESDGTGNYKINITIKK